MVCEWSSIIPKKNSASAKRDSCSSSKRCPESFTNLLQLCPRWSTTILGCGQFDIIEDMDGCNDPPTLAQCHKPCWYSVDVGYSCYFPKRHAIQFSKEPLFDYKVIGTDDLKMPLSIRPCPLSVCTFHVSCGPLYLLRRETQLLSTLPTLSQSCGLNRSMLCVSPNENGVIVVR